MYVINVICQRKVYRGVQIVMKLGLTQNSSFFSSQVLHGLYLKPGPNRHFLKHGPNRSKINLNTDHLIHFLKTGNEPDIRPKTLNKK